MRASVLINPAQSRAMLPVLGGLFLRSEKQDVLQARPKGEGAGCPELISGSKRTICKGGFMVGQDLVRRRLNAT